MQIIVNNKELDIFFKTLENIARINTTHQKDFIDYLSASGTLVALVAIFLPLILNKLNKPKLKIDVGNGEPYARNTQRIIFMMGDESIAAEGFHSRIKVINAGKTSAKQCHIKLIALSDGDITSLRRDFDPINLHWVGSDSLEHILSNKSESTSYKKLSKNQNIEINSNEYAFADFLSINNGDSNFIFQAIDLDAPRGIKLDYPKEADMFGLVTAYCDNTEPTSKIVHILGNNTYNKIEIFPATEDETKKFLMLLKDSEK